MSISEDLDGWRWQIGFCNGIGPAVWQQRGDQMRRITNLGIGPQGLMLGKSMPDVLAKNSEPHWPADKMVIFGIDPNEDVSRAAGALWESAGMIGATGRGPQIIQANGPQIPPVIRFPRKDK